MPIKKANTRFKAEMVGLVTNMGLVSEAMNDPNQLEKMMKRYRQATLSYLDWFLEQHKIVVDVAERQIAARTIWDRVMALLPEQLATKWSKGNVGFRDVLCETIHLGYLDWQRPAAYQPPPLGLASPVPGDDTELLRRQREDVLEKARERLREGDETKHKDKYYAFVVWESDKEASRHELNRRMAKLRGRRVISNDNYRKCLSKAWDQFGRYLAEEVGKLFEETEELSVDRYCEAFEKLDLMDDYAIHFRYCRCLLDLPEEATG